MIRQPKRLMGKTYRNVHSGSQSVSFKSPHARGALAKKKAHTHRQERMELKTVDDEGNTHHKKATPKVKEHWASAHIGTEKLIPNSYWSMKDLVSSLAPADSVYQAKKYSGGDFHEFLKTTPMPEEKSTRLAAENDYMRKAVVKQIERRGKIGMYRGEHKTRSMPIEE